MRQTHYTLNTHDMTGRHWDSAMTKVRETDKEGSRQTHTRSRRMTAGSNANRLQQCTGQGDRQPHAQSHRRDRDTDALSSMHNVGNLCYTQPQLRKRGPIP